MPHGQTKITRNSQVTLPVAELRKPGLEPNDVVVPVLEQSDARHKTASTALADHAAAGSVLLPASAYAESLVNPMQMGEEAAARADAFPERSAVGVAEIDSSAGREAALLRATHDLVLADALVLGVAAAEDTETIRTADRRWAAVSDRVIV